MRDKKVLTFPQTLLLLLIGGGLYLFFGVTGLNLWAMKQENPRARTFFTTAMEPVVQAADKTAPLVSKTREDFQELILRPFPSLAGYSKSGSPLKEEVPEMESIAEASAEAVIEPSIEKPAPSDTEQPLLEITLNVPEVEKIVSLPAETATSTTNLQPGEIEESSDETVSPIIIDLSPANIKGVLLMGDSLANSTSDAMIPLAETIPELNLIKHGKVSSNLANPVFVDWFGELDILLAEEEFHTVIIMLGANAAQSMTLDGVNIPWDSDEWVHTYKERASLMIKKLEGRVEQIVWVGIPPMLKRNYKDKMIRQNEIINEICAEEGIRYIPLNTIIGDEKGNYTDYKIVGGRQEKVRLTDTIHYTRIGAEIVSRYLLDTLLGDEIDIPQL